MASSSVTGALVERYQTFAVADAAPIWFHEAPASASLPYVVLVDEGTVPEYDLEYNPLFERTTARFEVYHTSLASADAVAAGIRFNGGAVNDGRGMDFGSLDLTDQELKAMIRTGEQRFVEGPRGTDARPVFRVRMTYHIDTQRLA